MSAKNSVVVCLECGTVNASGAQVCVLCGAIINFHSQRKPQKHITPILWYDPIIGAVSGGITMILISILLVGDISWLVVWGLVCGAIGAIIARPLVRRWFPTLTDPQIISILGGVLGSFVPILFIGFLLWLVF